jgi:hypothetical protein
MVKIEISNHVALVLFDFLAREIDNRKALPLATAIVHPAEFWALNSLHGSLERTLTEPLVANYVELVAAAQKKVMDASDSDYSFKPK